MIRGDSGLPPEEVSNDGISVLYVDDYVDLCRLAAAGIEEASERITVETTTDPGTVTDRLDEFDCIVSDYQMPETDGLELLRQVRVFDETIPFVLFTGQGSEGIASDAISLGVTDYLTKRGSHERFTRLANRIEGAVRAHRAGAAVQRTKTRARATIERDRARFRALTEHSPATMAVLDESGRYEYVSPSVEDLTGYRPRQLLGEVAFERVHDDDVDQLLDEFRRSLANPEYAPRVEYRFEHEGGTWLHLESKGVNRMDDPDVEGFIVNTGDVTEEKRTRRRLERERGVADELMEVAAVPVMVVDGTGEVLRINRSALEAFEMDERDAVGRTIGGPNAPVETIDGDRVAVDELAMTLAVETGRRYAGVEYVVTLPTGRFGTVLDVAPASTNDSWAAVVSMSTVEPL